MIIGPPEERIAKQMAKLLEENLNRLGLLCRVFHRVKSEQSLENKLNKDPDKYKSDGKKIQDLFGFRITLYFPDDLAIAQTVVSNLYTCIEETVDDTGNSNFSATRCNFIYKLLICIQN